jgi:hypothetical protein
MLFNLKFSGIAAQEAGQNTLEIDLPGPASVETIRRELLKKIPALGRYQIHFSMQGNLLSDEKKVLEGQEELLVFSPYSGG